MTICLLSDETVDYLESLAKLATDGPWEADALDNGSIFNISTADAELDIAIVQAVSGDQKNAQRIINTRYIAAAHPLVLRALLIERRSNPAIGKQAAWGRLNDAILSIVASGAPGTEQLQEAWGEFAPKQ